MFIFIFALIGVAFTFGLFTAKRRRRKQDVYLLLGWRRGHAFVRAATTEPTFAIRQLFDERDAKLALYLAYLNVRDLGPKRWSFAVEAIGTAAALDYFSRQIAEGLARHPTPSTEREKLTKAKLFWAARIQKLNKVAWGVKMLRAGRTASPDVLEQSQGVLPLVQRIQQAVNEKQPLPL